MSARRPGKWVSIALATLVVLTAGGLLGYLLAVSAVKQRVVKALGAQGEAREIRVGFSGVHIKGLRIKGPDLWPADDALKAESVLIVPDVRALFSGKNIIRSVTIDKAYLSVQRNRSGKLLTGMSALTSSAKTEVGKNPPRQASVVVGTVTLKDASIDFFDETIGPPRRKICLENITMQVRGIDSPAFSSRSTFALTGTIKGAHQDGTFDVSGWVVPASRDSSVKARIRSVPLSEFQPYVSKARDIKVKAGLIDLDLASEVKDRQLKAPGRVTISELKLAPAKDDWDTFLGVPRGAVLALLKDRKGRITLDFVLSGDIDNPKFSLNETLSKRLSVSMADTLRTGIGDVAEGAGSLGEKGVDAAAGVARGVGGAVRKLFGEGGK